MPGKCEEPGCGHEKSSHFTAEMGSFCKECPIEGNQWEHTFREPASSTLGPTAQANRALLPDEVKPLFDWFTEMLKENGLFWGGLIQAIACHSQEATYWEIIAMAKKTSEQPQFQRVREMANKMAKAMMTEKKETVN